MNVIIQSFLLFQQHSGHVARGCPGYGPAHVGGLACRVVHVPVVRPHAAGLDHPVRHDPDWEDLRRYGFETSFTKNDA